MDTYVLFKNGQLLYNGNSFPTPDVNQHVLQSAGGYDAARYPQRGDGYNDWNVAGRPPFDVNGRELDPAGWPTGKMKEGYTNPSITATPAAGTPAPGTTLNLLTDLVPVTIAEVDSAPVVIKFDVPTGGLFYLLAGEGVAQAEQDWVIEQHGEVKERGDIGVDRSDAFQLEQGPGTLSVSYRKGSVSDAALAQRVASGQGVSFGHYGLRAA